jgi:hypothetical protein
MLLYALLLTVLGLWNLLLPRKYFLHGSRWQLRDGDRAEASDEYVIAVRAGGVFFLLAAVSLTIWHFSMQAEKEAEESLEAAWGVSMHYDDELRVIENPEVLQVQSVEASLAALSGARMGLPTWRTAVVGQDEVGNLGVTVHDGDLWMAARAGGCEPAVLMVHETERSVTVAMTADSRPLGSFNTYVPCFSSGYQMPTFGSLVIVRVPLDEPLGNRQVLTVPAPDRDDLGVPMPTFTYQPETPAPTPTPVPTP